MSAVTRRSTFALLASSLLFTIGRGATLPFMTIYLTRQYGLGVDVIGTRWVVASGPAIDSPQDEYSPLGRCRQRGRDLSAAVGR